MSEFNDLQTGLENNDNIVFNIRSDISISEQEVFIKKVMSYLYDKDRDLIFFNVDTAFMTLFLEMFTDYEMQFDEIDNIILRVAIKNAILDNSFAQDLKSYVDKHVMLSLQNNEATEAVAFLANRTLDGANKLCNILDNLDDLTKNGKFLKVIPKKKLDTIFGWINKIAGTVAEGIKKSDQNNIAKINTDHLK